MTSTGTQDQQRSILRNRPLLTLMLGHFTLDMYVGLLPVLYPLLIDRFALTFRTVGLVSLAYSGMASISQPFFGWLADRFGTRFIGLALIWTATLFATIGFAPSFPLLVLLAAVAGVGSGAYHPFGALSAHAVIPAAQRNTAMSVYVTGGTLGVALGPLIGAVLFSAFGIHGTALMFLPGIGSALWLLYELRTVLGRCDGATARVQVQVQVSHPPVPLVPLIAVLGVMMSRNWTIISLEAYVPAWYKVLGYGPAFYGPLATTIVLASAVGNVGAGSLADRYGRQAVIVGTLVLSIPVLLLFAQFPGPSAFVTGALVGLLAASTGPLMLVMAQELMARRAGMASGLVLGLGFVTGAIGVPVTGAAADAWGMQAAVRLQVILIVATIGLARLLPSEARLRALQRAATRETGTTPTRLAADVSVTPPRRRRRGPRVRGEPPSRGDAIGHPHEADSAVKGRGSLARSVTLVPVIKEPSARSRVFAADDLDTWLFPLLPKEKGHPAMVTLPDRADLVLFIAQDVAFDNRQAVFVLVAGDLAHRFLRFPGAGRDAASCTAWITRYPCGSRAARMTCAV